MDTSLLIQSLNFITPLSSRIEDRLNEYVIEEQFSKKHLLVKEGQTAKRIYFINSGFARAYFYRDDKEFTGWRQLIFNPARFRLPYLDTARRQ